MKTFIALIYLLFALCFISHADIDLDKWAAAIYKAEGSEKAVVPYGMFFDGCDWDNVEYCRKIVKNTVFNTLVKYRFERCKNGEADVSCMARRYCPLNDPRDVNGLNKNWEKNVKYFLER